MNHLVRFDQAFAACPLIAILRGIAPEEVADIGKVLFAAGFRIIEVPLNSPQPFDSIAQLVQTFGDRAVIGAGTVTRLEEVLELARIGAAAVISPHADLTLVRATVAAGMVSLPGILSPTEAFAALAAGATGLKLFPMEMIGISGVKALKAVLPKSARLIGVGGIGSENIKALRTAGCTGFGIGSTLYKPGDSAKAVGEAAKAMVQSINSA
jgi:2-dehydro-3-deoxyphosphogalactonate aldolase